MLEEATRDLQVAIVDDDRDLRTTLVKGLEKFGMVCRPFASGTDFLEALSYYDPDCILLDLRMPQMDGLEVLRLVPAEKRHIPVVLFTSHGDIPTAVEAMRYGARDFLEKPMRLDQVQSKIRSMAGSSSGQKAQTRKAIRAKQVLESLTAREGQVIRMACDGMRNIEIAEKLGLSVRTVELHRHNAGKKLGTTRIASIINLQQEADSIN